MDPRSIDPSQAFCNIHSVHPMLIPRWGPTCVCQVPPAHSTAINLNGIFRIVMNLNFCKTVVNTTVKYPAGEHLRVMVQCGGNPHGIGRQTPWCRVHSRVLFTNMVRVQQTRPEPNGSPSLCHAVNALEHAFYGSHRRRTSERASTALCL